MSIARFLDKDTGPFVSAHRGYSAKAPENTLPALESHLKPVLISPRSTSE